MSSDKRLDRLKAAHKEAEQKKEWAWQNAAEVYRERDLLVCALARLYPSHVMETGRGRVAICIHTPAGQIAWTFPRKALKRQEQAHGGTFAACLSDMPVTPNDWDRAKTAERYDRLIKLARNLLE